MGSEVAPSEPGSRNSRGGIAAITGDHIEYISSVEKFRSHYPEWSLTRNVDAILREIYDACR
jgi:hypothetical protein